MRKIINSLFVNPFEYIIYKIESLRDSVLNNLKSWFEPKVPVGYVEFKKSFIEIFNKFSSEQFLKHNLHKQEICFKGKTWKAWFDEILKYEYYFNKKEYAENGIEPPEHPAFLRSLMNVKILFDDVSDENYIEAYSVKNGVKAGSTLKIYVDPEKKTITFHT